MKPFKEFPVKQMIYPLNNVYQSPNLGFLHWMSGVKDTETLWNYDLMSKKNMQWLTTI